MRKCKIGFHTILQITMQNLHVTIMQALIKLLTPTSPAYNNTVAFERPSTPKEIEQLLQPGDIIFSRTNSNLYEIARKYIGMNYDHVAVVISSRQVIHISPPIIGKLDIGYIVDPKRQPMIIRPKVEDPQKFLLVLNNYLGQKYNVCAIKKIGLREMKSKLKIQQKIKFSLANLKHSRICSDSVLYALTRASPAIEKSLGQEVQKTKFEQLGFFLPDEIAQILLANNAQILLKSKFQSEYKIVDMCSRGGKKLVYLAQKAVRISRIGSKKIKQKLNSYKTPQKQKIQPNEATISSLSSVEIISLILGLGHNLGILTLTSRTRFMMLALNLMIIIGHFQQMKRYILKSTSNL